MTSPTLHVVFNFSAAGELRRALAAAGRAGRVVAVADDLSFGPIDPPDPAIRAAWVEEELGYDYWQEIAADPQGAWAAAPSGDDRIVLWTTRRRASDYAGFLDYLWRLGDRPCEVVDLTEAMVVGRETPSPYRAVSLGLLPVYQILESHLLDRAQPLDAAARDAHRALWRKLRAENAALRVISPDLTLTSAPLTFFDASLLSRVTDRWQKGARIVGETMAQFFKDEIQQAGDLVLASRLRALADAGVIETQGNLAVITHDEVRLPQASESRFGPA